MQRLFLEDVGRIKRGEIRDYPIGTWRQFFPDFERQTAPVELVAPLEAADRANARTIGADGAGRPGGGRRG